MLHLHLKHCGPKITRFISSMLLYDTKNRVYKSSILFYKLSCCGGGCPDLYAFC